ncbi:DUF4013 domain-containing protein [Halorarum halobium]|uniref:DUF4013 domain-containing protein n=1 Tax=Halorarum halobium TaxID=3075121 RepID=UPI0028ABDA07|nr:DUF4013 domain-containing protein [Halobaculum sp. XH14]
MLEESLRYPLESDDSIATLLIGALLTVLSILIIPAFIVQGYLVRVLRSSVAGETEAPSFTDWGDLFVDGLKLFLINLVFGIIVAIPFVIVTVVFLGGAFAAGDAGGGSGAAALGLLSLLLFAVVGLLALVLAYFLPAMFANFAVEGRLGAAFDLSTVRAVAFTSEYFVAVLLGVVAGAVLNSVGGTLAFILVGLPILFYGQVVTYYLFGRGYAEGRTASGLSPAPGSTATTTDRSGGV